MQVVLAGFGPFPGAPFNPSAQVAKALARRQRPALAHLERRVHVFATAYASVDQELPKLLAGKPDIVLIFGLAARRHQLCIEMRARNAMSVLFPDATGYRPPHGWIAPGKPSARRGNASFVRLLGAAKLAGVPSRLSRDAGRYLCNYAYWQALQQAGRNGPLVQFVHIPKIRASIPARRRAGRRPPSLAGLVRAAETILIALIATKRARTESR